MVQWSLLINYFEHILELIKNRDLKIIGYHTIYLKTLFSSFTKIIVHSKINYVTHYGKH